jgi:Sulfotransferase domain
VIPAMHSTVARRVRHLKVRTEDSFVACYPRSGNTWLRFMLYEVLTGETADFPRVRAAMPHVNPYSNTQPILSTGGRLFLMHEQNGKSYRDATCIYVVRDVRDVVASEYRRQRMNASYRWNFDRFLDDFLRGRLHRFGSWTAHVAG